MRAWMSVAAVGCLAFAPACGPNCQSSCNRIYAESGDCQIKVAGQSEGSELAELIRQCVTDCETALNSPGLIGNYEPNERALSGQTIKLRNEEQAAAWMDCIDKTACQQIDEGFCAPI